MVALRERYKEAKDRVEELETVNGALRDAASNNLARVEELGKDNESLLGKIVFLREGAEKREARVGKLGKECDRLAGRNVELEAACLGYDGLHSTEEQIDAAWGCVHGGAYAALVEPALNRLGIKRCFGCDGHGETRNEDGELVGQCLVCNSHGWVIKEPK